jgi:hypothetical protein
MQQECVAIDLLILDNLLLVLRDLSAIEIQALACTSKAMATIIHEKTHCIWSTYENQRRRQFELDAVPFSEAKLKARAKKFVQDLMEWEGVEKHNYLEQLRWAVQPSSRLGNFRKVDVTYTISGHNNRFVTTRFEVTPTSVTLREYMAPAPNVYMRQTLKSFLTMSPSVSRWLEAMFYQPSLSLQMVAIKRRDPVQNFYSYSVQLNPPPST